MENTNRFETILIVDDMLENLQLLSKILIDNKYKVRAVKTGIEALASVNAELPDLILLDIKLPDISGYDVCIQLKSNEKTFDVPILFLSALNEKENIIRGFEVGGLDFITKPFHVEEVITRVKSYLEIKRLRSQLEKDAAILVQSNNLLNIEITERKLAEEKIRTLLNSVEKERIKLAALINSINDEVWFTDTNKKFTLANPTALKNFGLNPDELDEVEKFASKLIVLHPDGSPRPVEEAPPLIALNGQQVINFEEIVQIPTTGEYRHRLINACPVKDPNGNIIGAVSVVHDITELKHAEHIAAERIKEIGAFVRLSKLTFLNSIPIEEILQKFNETLPESWQYPNITCTRIVVDDQEFRSNNFSESEWSQSAKILVSGKELGRIDVFYTEEKPFVYEGPFMKEERELLDTIAERIGHMIEHSNAEKVVRESENRISQLLQSTDQGILGTDNNGCCTFINKSGLKILGYELEECIGKNIHWLIHYNHQDGSASRAEDCPIVNSSRKGVGCRKDDEVFWKKNGESFYTEYSSYPIIEDGIVAGSVIAFQDISERKQVEVRLAQQMDELRRWQTIMLGREDRNMQLKAEVNELLVKLGEPIRYPSQVNNESIDLKNMV